jgi:hypothetical protein
VTVVTDGPRQTPYPTRQGQADTGLPFGFGASAPQTQRTTKMSRFSMMEAASAVLGRMTAARQRRRTLQILESLPDHIRKDIGWSTDRRMAPTYLAD